jgi:hypothetical protein
MAKANSSVCNQLANRATNSSLERATRIELAFSAWEADVLPLNYARVP